MSYIVFCYWFSIFYFLRVTIISKSQQWPRNWDLNGEIFADSFLFSINFNRYILNQTFQSSKCRHFSLILLPLLAIFNSQMHFQNLLIVSDCFLKIYNEGFSGLAFHKLEELHLINWYSVNKDKKNAFIETHLINCVDKKNVHSEQKFFFIVTNDLDPFWSFVH